MLAITCKDGSRFRLSLGDGRWVYVVCEVKRGDKLRLKFDAPDTVGIYRDELWLKIVSERFLNILENVPAEALV